MSNKKKIILSVLKEIDNGKFPTHNDYNITEMEFSQIVQSMVSQKLVSGIVIKAYVDEKYPTIKDTCNVSLTMNGMDYLEENSTLMKTYRGLKEIREWMPF